MPQTSGPAWVKIHPQDAQAILSSIQITEQRHLREALYNPRLRYAEQRRIAELAVDAGKFHVDTYYVLCFLNV